MSLQSFTFVIISTFLIGFLLHYQCRTLCSKQSSTCNLEVLPGETMILLMMMPLFYSMLFKEAPWRAFVSSWFMTIVWLLICIFEFKATNSLYSVVVYIPLSFFIMKQNQMNKNELRTKDDQILQIQKEGKLDKKNQHNMVSNVTHDLKTVSKCAIIKIHFSNINIFFYLANVSYFCRA